MAPSQQRRQSRTGSTTVKAKSGGRKGAAKEKGSARQDSRGSRGTSTRGASQSVAPTGQTSTQVLPEDEEQEEVEIVEEEEEEDDDDEEEGAGQVLEEDDWQRQEAFQKSRSAAMGPLMKAMDAVQQDRYSVYRRSFLEKRHVKRLINHLTGQNTTQQVAMLTAAIAKIFVGEIVEAARKIQEEKGITGALRPEHLLEAHRMYKEQREIPGRFPPGAPSASAGTGGNGKRRRLF